MAALFTPVNKTGIKSRRLKAVAQLALGVVGVVCFILSMVFDGPLEDEYVDYFSNPIKIVFQPLPERSQEPAWSSNL